MVVVAALMVMMMSGSALPASGVHVGHPVLVNQKSPEKRSMMEGSASS